MPTLDRTCTIAPYFKIHDGKAKEFRALCQQFVEKTRSESGCHFYGFTFADNEAHCQESYASGDALLAHLENVGPLIGEALKISDIIRIEVHGPQAELEKVRAPLADFSPRYYTMELGFRRSNA